MHTPDLPKHVPTNPSPADHAQAPVIAARTKAAGWANASFDADGFPMNEDGTPYFPGRSY